MTDLKKLTVSLTKHGAHKVAFLLRDIDADDILKHLWGSVDGINIEEAQARKTLLVDDSGKIPTLWNDAKELGTETIDALVLLSIITSHHKLISAMIAGGENEFCGTINRGAVIDGKEFTNFAHIIEELGYSTNHSTEFVSYDLHKLFRIEDLGALASRLFELRLTAAGWDNDNSLIDELISLGFDKVFSINAARFQEWLENTKLEAVQEIEESEFFFYADDAPSEQKFEFRPGHNEKKTGEITISQTAGGTKANLLHNQLQNSLFADLEKKYGKGNVGTENPAGQGTSIDIVVHTDDFCWFYEIKTAKSVKTCIRQAIPQLLEYAYWDGKGDRADRLIIVSPLAITKEAEVYLNYLRDNFKLEIFYEQYSLPLTTNGVRVN